MKRAFKFGLARVRDFRVETGTNEATGKPRVSSVEVEDTPMTPTKRFWNSFFTRFGISDKMFKYFDHQEVFQRIAERVPDDTIRYCVERAPGGEQKLLAVSNPDRPAARPGEVHQLIAQYDGRDVKYEEGIVTSAHVPSSGDGTVRIGPDQFKHRFMLETPIDGYGNPRIYLSLLRLVCSNGMIAYAPTFRSEIRVGKNVNWSIARALETYDNGEGYAALRQRFESAQNSWASINEAHKLYRTLVKLQSAGQLGPAVLGDFHRVTGNLNGLYGMANLDALSVKRQRVLPARCRVYDLLNFVSELATHHAEPLGGRALQGYLGSLISDEYDMEGTAEKMRDFNDFFVTHGDVGPASSMN